MKNCYQCVCLCPCVWGDTNVGYVHAVHHGHDIATGEAPPPLCYRRSVQPVFIMLSMDVLVSSAVNGRCSPKQWSGAAHGFGAINIIGPSQFPEDVHVSLMSLTCRPPRTDFHLTLYIALSTKTSFSHRFIFTVSMLSSLIHCYLSTLLCETYKVCLRSTSISSTLVLINYTLPTSRNERQREYFQPCGVFCNSQILGDMCVLSMLYEWPCLGCPM